MCQCSNLAPVFKSRTTHSNLGLLLQISCHSIFFRSTTYHNDIEAMRPSCPVVEVLLMLQKTVIATATVLVGMVQVFDARAASGSTRHLIAPLLRPGVSGTEYHWGL